MSARTETPIQYTEADLDKLQREFRIMEADRRAFAEESQAKVSTNFSHHRSQIRKQRAAITRLTTDNDFLRSEIALAQQKRERASQTAAAQTNLRRLEEQIEGYRRTIEVETTRRQGYEKKIQLIQEKSTNARAEMSGPKAPKDTDSLVAKQIGVLENRLDQAQQKYNGALAANSGLRERIDTLRRERLVFENIYKRMERQLSDQKKEMGRIIEASNEAYVQRDQIQEKTLSLKKRNDQDVALYEAELRELNRVIEQDRKVKDLMKFKERETEKPQQRKVEDGTWQSKTTQQISLEKVQTYEEAFDKIKKETGISDIDELVHQFIKVEDQNFSLFNYVNELNNEVEKLEEANSDLLGEIEKYKGQGANSDSQRRKIVGDLEDKLHRSATKADQLEFKNNQAMRTINSLKESVLSLFHRIGCSTTSVSDMLGPSGVTESNVMQYLGIIEQQTNEIVQMYVGIASKTDVERGPDGSPDINNAGSQVTVVPPNTHEDYESEDEEDEDERPLTRDELKLKTLKGLGRREAVARAGKGRRATQAGRMMRRSILDV